MVPVGPSLFVVSFDSIRAGNTPYIPAPFKHFQVDFQINVGTNMLRTVSRHCILVLLIV